MSFNNGHESGVDLAVEIAAINVKLEVSQKNQDIHSEILRNISETQNNLSQKLLALEIKRQNDFELIKSLQKNTSLNTKLLGLVVTAIVATAIKFILHM